MAKAKATKNGTSTAQQIASVIKSARDIMRKDKGLNGDLDRLPMLTWIMFLKFLDDSEQVRETEATLRSEHFVPAIEPPYRWRDWAGDPKGITGDELIAFINQDEAVRPDGERGSGLFAYLRSLQGSDGGDRRDVVATVFRGTINRMINGYLLRDVVSRINNIHFTSSDEVHTLGLMYESMLKEMRDAAGDSGEFYTPRPVVEFIARVVDPHLGETVLDPAAGTGGFLGAAYEHLKDQCQTVEDREILQRETFFGIEPKPLPYLLCQMNLVLHGLEYPNIDAGNALRFPLRDIGDKDRVDVILTNPPFGGEEEVGILRNFPDDKRTAETALLFLQLIMRKLRRSVAGSQPGRCGMVVPDGVLFGDGVCARIKQELLREFNLHTIIRLPAGVFAPYTDIETNLIFFDRSGPTDKVWFYEHPLPEGRKKYTKTQPLVFREFGACLEWWNNRCKNDFAWVVSLDEIVARNYDLDVRNPSRSRKFELPRPPALAQALMESNETVAKALSQVGELEDTKGKPWPRVPLSSLLSPAKRLQRPEPGTEYRQIGVRLWGEGAYEREPIDGARTKYKTLCQVAPGDVIVNKIWARHGSVAVVQRELAGCFCSAEFPVFVPDTEQLEPGWFDWLTKTPAFWDECSEKSRGTSGKNRIRPDRFLQIEIPLPPISEQRRMLGLLNSLNEARAVHESAGKTFSTLVASVVEEAFSGRI
jgi:type I restriction enzyme M protein